MKKKILGAILASALLMTAAAGCSGQTEPSVTDTSASSQESAADTSSEESSEETDETDESSAETSESSVEILGEEGVTIRVGSLNGPTTVGILNLMQDAENGESIQEYEFTMLTQPDELAASFNAGDLDIALIPANLASVLYNRTEGQVSVIDINTLGVLKCISADDSINSVADLSGRTIYSVGQGATPEYAMNFLLDRYGVTDCTIEFRAEAPEIAALLAEDPMTIAILPEPAATAQTFSNEALSERFDLAEQWNAVSDDSMLITGVTVVRNDFLAEHPAAVDGFLQDHRTSVADVIAEPEATASLAVEQGLFPNDAVAQASIPRCNITCITADVMQELLSGYLQTLYDENPQAVGGQMPADDFYYLG